MKDCAPDWASLQSTPAMRPRPAALREKRSSAGASCSQGPHQLAQNTTTAGRPREPASRPASVIGRHRRDAPGEARVLAGPAVAERLDANPKIARAASAAPATSIHPSSRRPLGIVSDDQRGTKRQTIAVCPGPHSKTSPRAFGTGSSSPCERARPSSLAHHRSEVISRRRPASPVPSAKNLADLHL